MKKKPQPSISILSAILAILIIILLVWGGYTLGVMNVSSRPNCPRSIDIEDHTNSILSENSVKSSLAYATEPPSTVYTATGIATEITKSPPSPESNEDLVDLKKNVAIFEQTLKSCLGRHCIDISFPIPGGNNKKIDRYGILTPSTTLQIRKVYDGLALLTSMNAVYLFSTNVPTYGYGKNHGWTRIIRFVDNVAVQAFLDISSHFSSEIIESPKSEDIDRVKTAYIAQLRALMRWHCRLNHVAAHTTMLTIPTEQLHENPQFVTQSILTFLNVKDPKLFQDFYFTGSFGANRITDYPSLDRDLPKYLIRIASVVVQEEMQRSRNMTKWPCLPFKELAPHLLTPQKHRFFAPNCSEDGGYPKCSVNFDFAEQQEA